MTRNGTSLLAATKALNIGATLKDIENFQTSFGLLFFGKGNFFSKYNL